MKNIVFLLMPFLLCCLGKAEALAEGKTPAVEGREINIEQSVDSIFKTLSTREKIAQLMIIAFWSGESPATKELQDRLIKKEQLGGVIIMDDSLNYAVERLNQFHKMAKIPLLVTIDGEWGASMRYPELHMFPRQMQLGALSDETLLYEMGYAIGQECKDLNIHINFAPDVDINNNAENPVINSRSFGENKEIVARYGAAYMEGMRDAGVYGSAKHFPGHGDTNVDSHSSLPTLPFTRSRLDSLELYPFRYLIEKDVEMVMVGHLEVPVLDSTGTPASISKPIITDLLKNELGYKGIVITDALNMNGVSNHLEKKLIPLEAFKAGVDILLMPEDVEAAITEMEKAVKRGEISKDDLNSRVKKVLALKAKLGLFSQSYNPVIDTVGLTKKVVKESNKLLIEKLARASVTVLTNEYLSDSTQKALPIANVNDKKIGYLGFGKKNSDLFAKSLLRYAPADTLTLDLNALTISRLDSAKEKLSGCDLVIVGFNDTDLRPNKNFGIVDSLYNYVTDWAKEQDMVAAYMGSPYAVAKIEGYENFKAYVIGYMNTPANCEALPQVLFGVAGAEGKLPVKVLDFDEGYSVRYEKITKRE